MQTKSDHSAESPPPCMIFVDKNGTWFHKGAPIIHQGFLRLFYESLRRNDRGDYVIQFKDQVCRLEVEDTPFVINRVDYIAQSLEKDFFLLHLIDGTQEPLNPQTLFIGAENVLYCRVRDGVFRARFSRPSYYQFAQYVKPDSKKEQFYILLGQQKYYIENA